MDFTPALSAFQGVIISADSVYSFSQLKTRGGNEEKIKYVVDCLRNFFLKEKYMVENEFSEENIPILRKFAFYICINSDLPFLEELVDLDGIDFVIWTIPTVPKCLLCEIFWRLYMHTFLYEILVFTCPPLSMEVAEAFLDHFKYFEPTDCMQKLRLLSLACYRLICRLYFFNLEGDELARSFNNFQKCLKFYSEPPNASKLERLTTDEEYRFMGKRLYSMLQLVLDCLAYYTNPQKFKSWDFQETYQLTYRDGVIINEQSVVIMSNCNNNDILESIKNCNITLLDKCKNLVMDVSVEIFCAWTEFEEDGKNMQQTIGELCYKVHTTLCKLSELSNHAVVSMLQQISCKPLDLTEIINKTDIAVIIENINKEDSESVQWLKALLCKDNLCQNTDLIVQVATHLEVFSDIECYRLYKIIYSYLKENIENKENLLLLAIKTLQRCSSSYKHEIVEEHFSNERFSDSMQCIEFDNMMTEIFNKLIISPDIDLSDVLTVFVQNPRKVYSKVLSLASENVHQTDIMLRVMKCLDKYSNHYYNEETEPCLILVTKETITSSLDTDEKQNDFICFLKSLKITKAIPGPKLLLLIIMPNLHIALLNKNIVQICIQCKLLQAAYSLDELKEYRAPTLAMLAQVLDTVRWKMNTYVPLAPTTLELVLQLQDVLNTNDLTEKECTWLKSKLKNINPLNMYYFRRLWNPPGNTFVEVVSGMHIHRDMDIEHLSLWLSQTLSSTTLQEWFHIWESLCPVFGNLKAIDIVYDAILLLILAEKSNQTEGTTACLLYCVQNFVAIARYKYFKMPLTDCQVITIFDKFELMENVSRESNIETIATISLPLFGYMAEKKDEISIDLSDCLLKKFKHQAFVAMIKSLYITKK